MNPIRLILVATTLLLCQWPMRAQVFVKAVGQKAVPVRVQSLDADVEIVGSFAITDWKMKLALERVGFGDYYHAYNGELADFIVARPTDAKVTAFKIEQSSFPLTGRVVEKGIAVPRVAFRAAPNDPLLKSGLGPNNSFRTTIYPLRSYGEITASGTWVQVLPNLRNRSTYRLPLLSLKGATTRLKQLNVKVTVRDSGIQNLSSNYGAPGKPQNGVRALTINQKNYRVLRDLTLVIARKSAPLQSALLLAPDSKKEGGHFALALIADRDLKNPSLSGAGVASPETVIAPKAVRAGDVALFTGIYLSDASLIEPKLTANGSTRDVPASPVENPVAASLWATQKINTLANNPANRAQIIAVSKKFSVVSPFTSWLTVGNEDLRIYQYALVSAQLDPMVREYWMRVSDAKEKSARTVQLRKSISQISAANRLVVEDELYLRLGSAYGYVLSQKYSDYNNRLSKAKKVNVEKRIARLSEKMLRYVTELNNKKAERSVDWASPVYGGELYDLRTRIVQEYRKPHPDFTQLEKWQLRFAKLYGSTYIDPRQGFWRAQVTAQNLEKQTTLAEKSGDQTKLSELQLSRNDNTRNAYFVNNIGDPPIYVAAPADARQVVAIMPDGKIKTLEYNAAQKRWEGNYDVPVTTKDGDYSIQIVIVNADQSRRRYAMKFRVDTAPPTGEGQVLMARDASAQSEKPLRLEIEHGGDVARVTALLPWGEKVALLPSTIHGQRFFAMVTTPREYIGKAIKVTYILVDRAHNLTSIEAESVSPTP